MGLWAGIKHALNSTLGTKDFMPLDKMILGMRSLQASDEVYWSLIPLKTSTVLPNKTKTFSSKQSITPYTSGSLKLSITYAPGGSGYGGSSNVFNVLINGVVVDSISLETSKTPDEYMATSAIIQYDAGDVITFNAVVSSGPNQSLNFVCSGINVLGTLTEFSALNIKTL